MRQNVPDYVRPYADRAKQFEKEDKYDEAIAVFREALARYPDIAVLHNNLGCSLANIEDYQQAEKEFQQAIELTPVNRRDGIVTPENYPAEPTQNLRAVQARIKGPSPFAPRPARSRTGLRFDPFHPGMGFLRYVFWFMGLSPIGWLLVLAAVVVTGVLWHNHSPYYPTAFGISCLIILLVTFIAYVTDSRLRGK